MKSPSAAPPIAFAVRARGRACDLLELVACPYCGKKHLHGAGNHDSPFGWGDGHRVGHCLQIDNSGYVVIEVESTESAAA